MGVILDIAPKITVVGGVGGNASVDLTDVYEKIEKNKNSIGDLGSLETTGKSSLVEAVNEMTGVLSAKADLERVKAIEQYIISLEERLSRVNIEILDPTAFLFLD